MPIDHWMMFGTFAEQRHFVYPTKNTYRGTVINGNMAAHAPEGLAGFVLEKTANQTYLIDPMTHAFQHDPYFVMDGSGKTRSSIERLAKIYGAPVEKIVGSRPVRPGDFRDDDILEGFVKRCLEFQSRTITDAMAQHDARKYLPAIRDENLKPYAVIAPYFFMMETSLDDWLDVYARALRFSRKHSGDAKLFASVVVSQGVVLDRGAWGKIVNVIKKGDVSGCLLWVDNLDEQQAGGAELQGLIELARSLRNGGAREVINLHGGYFSILAAGILGGSALSGVTHGPEFGEFRSVVPVGGGIPIARYYIPQLHTRIRYRDAIRVLGAKGWLKNAADFHTNVCDCSECRKTLDGKSDNFIEFGRDNVRDVRRGSGIVRIGYPTTETKLHCLRHYLQQKAREYQFASTGSRELIIADLDKGYAEFEEIVGLDGVGHLRLWKKLLS